MYLLNLKYLNCNEIPSKKLRRSAGWKLPWAAKEYRNEKHKGKLEEIRENHFRYWYGFYRGELKRYRNKLKLRSIYFFNINGKKIQRVKT